MDPLKSRSPADALELRLEDIEAEIRRLQATLRQLSAIVRRGLAK